MMKKKGVSAMVGYVLLISFVVVISVVVFQQLRTQVPTEDIECVEGVSMFISNYNYDCVNETLIITLKNTGRFSVGGYFIRASNSSPVSEGEVPIIDISSKIIPSGLYLDPTGVAFSLVSSDKNALKPNQEEPQIFYLNGSDFNQLTLVEITPIRWEEIDGRNRVVGCTDARIREELSCS